MRENYKMLPRPQSLAITFWGIFELIRHLHIHNAPYLPPKVLHKYCFQSLGTAVIPRRNEKQRLCKILGGK